MILNLTQHKATPEQVAAGVIDLRGAQLEKLKYTLTFSGQIPSDWLVITRAEMIAQIAHDFFSKHPSQERQVMIGGAPWFMPPLQKILHDEGLSPLYAFSERCSQEKLLPDGSVQKTQAFRHLGFKPAISLI